MSEIRVDTISEKTSANGVAVDGVTLKDGGVAATTASTITTADNSTNLSLVSTDADANTGPVLDFYRNSSSPADVDFLANITFRGKNDAGQDVQYVEIENYALDVSDGSEDGYLGFSVITAGANPSYFEMRGGEGSVFNQGSNDIDFRIESSGNAHMFFVDAGNNHINIGTADDLGGNLNVNGGIVVSRGDNLDNLTLISTDADATSGPVIKLFRNSSSPADSDDVGKILFTAENDASEAIDYATIRGDLLDVTDGTEDGIIKVETITAGSNLEMARFGDGVGVVLNESGNSGLDLRVESDGNTHMLMVNGGSNLVGIGADPDLGTGLHIKTADSGASANSSHDELVIEGSSNSGISILSGTSSNGAICFGDSGNNCIGFINYSHSLNHMSFAADGEDACLTVHNAQIVSMGVTENAPDVAAGLCISQGGSDGNIVTFKNSDVAHGMTGNFETDTFAAFRKQSATLGGLAISALSEGTEVLKFNIAQTDGITTKSTSAQGAVIVGVSQKNGTGVNVVGTDDNLMVITNYTNTQFIFDAEGTFHSNVGTATYDEYEDAQLVRAMDLSTSTKGLIASKFDEFVQYNHEDLANASIVGREEDGTPNSMVNWTAMSQLHNGAIWQQYEKHQKLASAFYKLAQKTIGKEEADKLLTEEEIQLLN